MPDDVIVGKVEIIERCLKRVADIYAGQSANLHQDLTKQDAILVNIQRSCQAAIDLAMRIIRMRALSVPKESKEAFKILEQGQIITPELSVSLQKMVGFRNIAIHEYQALDLNIVESVIQKRLSDLRVFAGIALRL
jgi:uncharacterized protein YutE (UPF0331/DUF86 family)